MLNQSIHNWLNSKRNFIVGRALYKQLGKDDTLKARLASGEHACTRKLLAEAMKALVTNPKSASVQCNETPAAGVMPTSEEIVLNALNNQWKPLYARINYLRHSLDQYGESNTDQAVAARLPIAFEILSLNRQCEAIWEKRDHYLLHGSLPLPDDIVQAPTDPIALAQYIEAVKRNIRRNRARMKVEGADAIYAQLFVKYSNFYLTLTGKPYEQKN